MDKGLELLQEEQLETLKGLRNEIASLRSTLSGSIDVVVNKPDEVKVLGEVQVNTEKEVTISNLDSLLDALATLGDIFTKAIETHSYEPIKSLVVENIQDAKANEVKITNLKALQDDIAGLKKAIVDNKPVINVEKQELRFPKAAKDAIPVRLSDGKSFYNAITAAVSSGVNTSGLATEAKQDDIITAVDSIKSKATDAYSIQAISDDGTYKYFFFEDASANYYILRKTLATSVFLYTKGTGGYASVYVSSSAGPSGSPTWASYGSTF